MASYNRVILLGNLTRDPELRYIPSGTAVTEIGLAVNERYKNSAGEWVEEPTFIDVTLWARTAEVASEYLSKGSPVLIEGRLKLDTWETPNGEKRSKLRVVGNRMQMLGARGGGGDGGGGARGGGGGGDGGGGGGGGGQGPAPQDSEYSQSAPPTENYDGPPDSASGDDIPF